MCYYASLDSLPSFGIQEINHSLRSVGCPLSKIDSLPPGSWEKISFSPLYFFYRDSWTGERREGRKILLNLRRDTEGLYLEIRYSLSTKESPGDMYIRYNLVKRESNLIPGTYRYYFSDPYAKEGDSLCSKLYFYPETGEFVPRSVLSSFGVLYSQQRKGHTQRYYFGISSRIPSGDKLRYRKTHYRGKITPFQERYNRLQEEEDLRLVEYLVGKGYARGILPRSLEKEVSVECKRHSGRKSSTRRKKVS